MGMMREMATTKRREVTMSRAARCKAKNAAPTGSEKPTTAARPMRHEFKTRGHRWRVQSDEKGRFDEIVVVIGKDTGSVGNNGLVLHAEMSSDCSGYVDVCGVMLWFYVGRDGIARISEAEDNRRGSAVYGRLELRDPELDRKGYR